VQKQNDSTSEISNQACAVLTAFLGHSAGKNMGQTWGLVSSPKQYIRYTWIIESSWMEI